MKAWSVQTTRIVYVIVLGLMLIYIFKYDSIPQSIHNVINFLASQEIYRLLVILTGILLIILLIKKRK